jgi:hypothetical protein
MISKIRGKYRMIARSLDKHLCLYAALATAGLLILAVTNIANAQVAMAPPVAGSDAAASGDTVFNWTEVPQNQDVIITRAVFDQGGYQLYDTSSETIVVPFVNNNLYVMKFAESTDGQIHFTNTGTDPVLTIPAGVGIENAADPGTFWYPIPAGSSLQAPEYLGMAPSWDDFIEMGWYPGMVIYGGYCWGPDVAVYPVFGLSIYIGGEHYNRWDGYVGYYHNHPAPYHTSFWHRKVYTWAANPNPARPAFGGRVPAGSPSHHMLFPGTGPAEQHPSGGAGATTRTRTFRGGAPVGGTNPFPGTSQPGRAPISTPVGGGSPAPGHVFRGGGQLPATHDTGSRSTGIFGGATGGSPVTGHAAPAHDAPTTDSHHLDSGGAPAGGNGASHGGAASGNGAGGDQHTGH